jgi:hypothetical protein
VKKHGSKIAPAFSTSADDARKVLKACRTITRMLDAMDVAEREGLKATRC